MKKLVIVCLIWLVWMESSYAFEEAIEEDEGTYVEVAASIGVPNLNAKAAILYDMTYDRILYEKNMKQKRANASTTKMITALVAVQEGDLNAMVEVSAKAASVGGSTIGLRKGDKITLDDLIKGLLVHSGNDAAVAIAEHIAGEVEQFAILMNQKLEEIGAVDTHFVTPHGLDVEEHYSTAYDLMLIAKEVLKNDYLTSIVSTPTVEITINGNRRTIGTTNEMLSLYEGANGIKTGYTGNAGRCLVTSAKQGERQLISVVLGCDSKKNRTIDSTRLLDYGFQEYAIVDLGRFLQKEVYVSVNKSVGGIYRLRQTVYLPYPLKERELEKITVEYHIVPNLVAPLAEKTYVGNAIIRLDGIVIQKVEYVLPEKIVRKSWKDYWKMIFYHSFQELTNMIQW